MPQPELGQRLHSARAAAKISLGELERRTGISRQAIRNIESRLADPTTETVQKLAQALSVSAAWLAFGDDDVTDKEAR